MAQDVVINGTTYPAVESVALSDGNGNTTMFYPDAVRYVEQTLTEAQKATARQNLGVGSVDEVAEEVLARLQTPVFGRVDADNSIILTGELANGSYVVKYEHADGSKTVIGEIVTGVVDDNNEITKSTAADGVTIYGEDYNGDGVNDGYKLNTRASGGYDANYEGVTTTGYIPAQVGDVFYFKNITMSKTGNKYACRVAMFDAIASNNQMNVDNASSSDWFTWDANGNATEFRVAEDWYSGDATVKYIRVNASYIGADSIIYRNKPIE